MDTSSPTSNSNRFDYLKLSSYRLVFILTSFLFCWQPTRNMSRVKNGGDFRPAPEPAPEEFNSKKSLRIFVVYPWILHIFCLEFVENAKVLITVGDLKNPEHNGPSQGKDIDSAPFTLVHARSHCSPSRRKTTRGQTRLEFLVTSSVFLPRQDTTLVRENYHVR